MAELLNDRVLKIKGNNAQIQKLLEEYTPFIAKCAHKTAGRFISIEEHDEGAIAMEAFLDAIGLYNPERGSFLGFASGVIRNRLVDYWRKEQKYEKHRLLYENEDGTSELLTADDVFEEDIINKEQTADRKKEIESLISNLNNWGIDVFELQNACPKHAGVRHECTQAVNFLLNNKEAAATLNKNHTLPVNSIVEGTGVNKKQLDRFRKYIIALYIIYSGKYSSIVEFLNIRGLQP